MQSEIRPKTLYIVATPIGNLADLSPRAQAILTQVKYIAAEDTRHTGQLLRSFNIQTPLLALHDHNERDETEKLLARLHEGASIALVSDAGTPLISDPGFYLIRAAHQHGFDVRAIPGPCAAIAALSVAGLPADRFCFEGFLPVKSNARQIALEALLHEPRTLIFYEAPHRIQACLTTMCTVFGADREAALVKELTKTFETIRHGRLPELLAWLVADPLHCKGEFVILIQGYDAKELNNGSEEQDRILKILLNDLPLKQAVQLASKLTGAPKNALYERALSFNRSDEN